MANNVSSGGWVVYNESNDSYDLNTRILATAVICLASVVALMVFVHLYVRHVLFGRRRPSRRPATRHLLRVYVSNPAHDDEPANVGLDPADVAALPMHPYRLTSKQGGSGGKSEESPAECSICLSAVDEGEMVRVLPSCNHLFHVGCIDMWLGSHSTCPVCRTKVEPPSMATAVDVAEETSTLPTPTVMQESSGPAPASQEGTSSGSKNSGSVSSRLSSSFRRMLSWERPAGRRAQGEGMEVDLERQ